jgi:WD40 repeat protein
MRKLALLAFAAALAVYFTAACLQTAAEDVAEEKAVTSEPKLPSDGPIRRIGASDFRLTERDGNFRPFRFSPDGKLLAGANWFEVKIWTFPDGKLKQDLSSQIDSNCIAFSEDGSQLLAFEQREKTIYRFDVESGRSIGKTPIVDVVDDRGATYYRFSDDGRWLCSTEVYGHVMAWDTSSGKRLFRKKMMHSHQPRISKDGVLTVFDLFVDRYDITSGSQKTRFRIDDRRWPVTNAEGTLMASYSKAAGGIVFWDPATDERVGRRIPLEERQWRADEAALSADGRRFSYWVPQDEWLFNRKMAVFEVETRKVISSFTPPNAFLLGQPVISPDGRYVFPASGRSVFCPIDVETGRPVHDVPDHVMGIEALSFTPDGSNLVAGSRDQRRAWDVRTGRPGVALEQWYHMPNVAAVDNHRALVAGLRHGGVRLQDIGTGKVEREYEAGTNKHFAKLQLGADRKTFVGLLDQTYRSWNIATGATIAEWTLPNLPYGWEMQPYGRYNFGSLVLGGSRLIRFDRVEPAKRLADGSVDWGRHDLLLEDWTTHRVTNRLSVPYIDQLNVADLVDDGTLAVVCSDDWTTRASRHLPAGSTYLLIWDVASGWEQLRVSRPRPDYFSAFSMSAVTPDARLAATASHRNRIEIWNGFTGELLERLEAGNDVTKLAFSEDGRILASGHLDGSIYLWDTQAAWKAAIPKAPLSSAELQRLWDDLAGEGRAPALAMQRLLGDPGGTVAMLTQELRARGGGMSLQPARLIRLVMAELGDQLDKLRSLVLTGVYVGRVRIAADQLLAGVGRLVESNSRPAAPEIRRRLLGIRLAEEIGTAEAKRVLETMARGDAAAIETQAAAKALRRVGVDRRGIKK